ncbi:GNAT family N-acetyltransferase [Pseudomonas sp. XK-1]|uniref:GNAT family N-acetyltransferase n=1 Tax=Pseudomonas sp. XK-1 TaxID=3136019 RepID=UPI003119A927
MSPLQLAPLPAAQEAEALALLDQAFADDPTLAWYLFGQRPGYEARRRAYLAGYQAFHRVNRLPILAAWQNQQLLGLSYFSPSGHQPSAASLEHFGEVIRSQCGADCLERLDLLLEAFDQHAPAASGRIEFIAVATEHQGMGLGSALLSQSLAQLRASGCPSIALETGAPRNLALYQRHGFRLSARRQFPGLLQHYLENHEGATERVS